MYPLITRVGRLKRSGTDTPGLSAPLPLSRVASKADLQVLSQALHRLQCQIETGENAEENRHDGYKGVEQNVCRYEWCTLHLQRR